MPSSMAFCSGDFGKKEMLRLGPERAKNRRTKQQPSDELAHHGGLAEPQHHLAEQPTGNDQQDNLSDEQRLGRRGLTLRTPRRPNR